MKNKSKWSKKGKYIYGKRKGNQGNEKIMREGKDVLNEPYIYIKKGKANDIRRENIYGKRKRNIYRQRKWNIYGQRKWNIYGKRKWNQGNKEIMREGRDVLNEWYEKKRDMGVGRVENRRSHTYEKVN